MPIYKYPFLDFNQLNNELNIKNLKSNEKLSIIHNLMGGKKLSENILKGSVMGICSIGGFPIHLNEVGQLMIGKNEYTITEIKDLLYETIGISSFMSYLNPKNKSLMEISNTTIKEQHYSVLHTINLSIFICGITSGVEHELSSQRDIVHLSRLTVAKTKAQSNPVLVLTDEKYIQFYEKILNATKDILVNSEINDMEIRNLLFPSAKASAVMLTGSLKNFMKLIKLKESGGKENELIEVLNKLEKLLIHLFPELF